MSSWFRAKGYPQPKGVLHVAWSVTREHVTDAGGSWV